MPFSVMTHNVSPDQTLTYPSVVGTRLPFQAKALQLSVSKTDKHTHTVPNYEGIT